MGNITEQAKERIIMENSTIKNVSEYVRLVTGLNNGFYHPVAHLKTLYRGHSDNTWKVIPSAFRDYDHFLNERLYLHEFQRQLPEACDGLSYFDILVKAQHYGIPTRLLDFTLNPLVALYFACEKNSDKDGQVLIFQNSPVFTQEEITFQLIIHYIFKYKHGITWSSDMRQRLCKSLERSDDCYFIVSEELVERILTSSGLPQFVLPKLSNNRVRAQQGAFALFHTPVEKENVSNRNKSRKFAIPQRDIDISIKASKVVGIPACEKEKMLWELDCLGINKATLFPELEPHVTDIVRKIKISNKEINQRIT